MKNIFKRSLSLALVLIMVIGLLPVAAQAKVNEDGVPTNLEDKVILSVYIPSGDEFPGEPAVHSNTNNYRSFNSSFEVANSPTFANKASSLLKIEILQDLVEGTPYERTTVHGVYDANGLEKYFIDGASILDEEKERTMIESVFADIGKNANPDDYEIIWYVIKLQHEDARWFWERDVTEWHIDGIIKERQKISINYYGNGNTSGAAPNGTMNHISGQPYVILGNDHEEKMEKVTNRVSVAFLGWNTRPDGSGTTYQPGVTINPEESLSLYAMWDNYTVHTATVNTYLDDVLTSVKDLYGADRQLSLHADNDYNHYYDLTEKSTGVYTADINGNGTFYLYAQEAGADPIRTSNHQLVIYNQNGTLNAHHYSVTYLVDDVAVDKQIYHYKDTVTAAENTIEKEGYRFLGWKDEEGNLVQPGEEVTASISKPVVLTAIWEKTVNVTINVTVDHRPASGGEDKTAERDDVFLQLVNRADSTAPYLEIGEPLSMTNAEDALANGFTLTQENGVSTYTATRVTYADMPGGTAEYSVVTSKTHYDVESVEPRQDPEGNWIINVKMVFRPTNFDLTFNVKVSEQVPSAYIPEAVIVRISSWSSDRNRWEIITQHGDNAPGVRVNIDREKLTGSGSYPVWMDETENNPYGYRIRVSAFVYPDGTIVPVSAATKESDQEWTDEVYIATIIPDSEIGGAKYGDPNTGLAGAYHDAANKAQVGELEAVITMDLHDVIFNANEGKIDDKDSLTVSKQYKIPAFKNYVPVRDGGYVFAGWYLDEDCTTPAQEGEDLKSPITLYAKWNDPLTISGTVNIAGTYIQNGVPVPVNKIDKATEEVVVLQEIRNQVPYDVDSRLVTLSYEDGSEDGSGTYEFTGIPDDGKEYRIKILLLNYNTKYDNNGDKIFNDGEYDVVFKNSNEAIVDVQLGFVPPSYNQKLIVDATDIGEGFRPTSVLAKILYRDTGDNHPFQVISQHRDGENLGVQIALTDGEGEGYESIWKWHTDGTLYDYEMRITEAKVDDTVINSDGALFYIQYSDPVRWDENAGDSSAALVAYLRPRKYLVSFDLDANADDVVGMEEYWNADNQNYQIPHEWSKDTPITAIPQREGYTFKGWVADAEGVYVDGMIPAAVCQNVTLTAQWEKNAYQVTTEAVPKEGGSTAGDGAYLYDEQVTVTATLNTGFYFCGWYENGTLVFSDLEYTFTANSNRNLTAQFARNPYNVVAEPTDGGTTSGSGTYEYGQTITVTATAKENHMFLGWFEDGELVSSDAAYQFTVTDHRTLSAHFIKSVTVITKADPVAGGTTTIKNIENGETVTGTGEYKTSTELEISAEAKSGYYFIGWYYEDGTPITTEKSFKRVVVADQTYVARFAEKVSYACDYVYLFGYEDTLIGAEGPLLRGELAQMIYRLVKQRYPGTSNGNNTFNDTTGEWFQTGISYMAEVGAINVRRTNAFPYAAVTRGETYKMICLGLKFTDDADLKLSDYAAILTNSGFISGDGAVTATIKRYEFCELFNKILGRENYSLIDVNGVEVTHDTYGYTDLDPKKDYYKTMLLAASTFDQNGRVTDREERNVLDEYVD